MEMQFLTLLKDNNCWMDWVQLWFGDDSDGIEEPTEFPCYVSSEHVGYADDGDAIFWPHFLYVAELEEMLDRM